MPPGASNRDQEEFSCSRPGESAAPPPLRAASGATRGATPRPTPGGAEGAPAGAARGEDGWLVPFAGAPRGAGRGSRGGIGGAAPAAALRCCRRTSRRTRVADVDALVEERRGAAGRCRRSRSSISSDELTFLTSALRRHHEVALQSVLLRGGLILLEDQVAAVDLPVPISVRRQRERGALLERLFWSSARDGRTGALEHRANTHRVPSRRNSSAVRRRPPEFPRADARRDLTITTSFAWGAAPALRSIGAKDDAEDPPPTRVAPPAPPATAPAASAAAGTAAADSTTSSAVLAAPPAMKRLDTVEALEAQIAAEHAAKLERERLERRARILRDASQPPSMSTCARRQILRSKTTPVKRPPLNSRPFRDFSRARKRPTRAQTASRPLTAKSSPSLAAIVPGDGDAQSAE